MEQLKHTIDIAYNAPQWDTFANPEILILQSINATCKHLHAQNCAFEISILLTNDEEIQALNKQYRHKNIPTNVLSFPLQEFTTPDWSSISPGLPLGDIVVAYDTLEREAKEQGKPFAFHFTHLIIHSLLHLMGYDHMEEKDAENMELMEIKILNTLNIPNPYKKRD